MIFLAGRARSTLYTSSIGQRRFAAGLRYGQITIVVMPRKEGKLCRRQKAYAGQNAGNRSPLNSD
jgi:hypothetical protein